MTPKSLLADAADSLQAAGVSTPRLDAELLLCHVLEKERSWLIAHADDVLKQSDIEAFLRLIERRKRREPVAYLTGRREFWSRHFHVTQKVLIPRPETEHLIEAVLDAYPDVTAAYRFCDIGTGSGCIAVTLACEYPQAQIVASDISAAALAVAKANAEQHGVAGRIEWRQGDMFAALQPADGPFDAVISNPPYVGVAEMARLEPELAFEPRGALTDEADGLRYLAELVEQVAEWLKPGGLLMVETGLCGLPAATRGVRLEKEIRDLAGYLRVGIYRC